MGYAFISYSHTDQYSGEQLASYLLASGVPVWFDYGIDTGDSFSQRIAAAIDGCVAFVPVLTPASVSSKWVLREIARADTMNKPMWPLVRFPCALPLELAGLHYENVVDGRLPSVMFVQGLMGYTGYYPPPPVQVQPEQVRPNIYGAQPGYPAGNPYPYYPG